MNKETIEEPSEAEIVGRSRVDHLYTHEWVNGEGRYLNVILDDSGEPQSIDIDLEPHARNRIKVTVTFVRERGDITMIELRKFKHYKRKGWQPCPDDTGFGHQRITLRRYSFEKLLALLKFISELDISGITQRRLALTMDESQALDEDAKRKLRTLLIRRGGPELIAELLKTDLIGSQDIVNLGYRKQQLTLFADLLAKPERVDEYRRQHGVRADQQEAVWQHFFSHNEWIFGYGLDYRFQGILQGQFHASNTDADGSQAVISDFLLGDKRFTTFVELKTPMTNLFGQTQNRSRTWRLSGQLLDSVSQILEQKASGILRFERGALYDQNGNRIRQQPHDPKVILIIGSWDELQQCTNDRERETKHRTFESPLNPMAAARTKAARYIARRSLAMSIDSGWRRAILPMLATRHRRRMPGGRHYQNAATADPSPNRNASSLEGLYGHHSRKA